MDRPPSEFDLSSLCGSHFGWQHSKVHPESSSYPWTNYNTGKKSFFLDLSIWRSSNKGTHKCIENKTWVICQKPFRKARAIVGVNVCVADDEPTPPATSLWRYVFNTGGPKKCILNLKHRLNGWAHLGWATPGKVILQISNNIDLCLGVMPALFSRWVRGKQVKRVDITPAGRTHTPLIWFVYHGLKWEERLSYICFQTEGPSVITLQGACLFLMFLWTLLLILDAQRWQHLVIGIFMALSSDSLFWNLTWVETGTTLIDFCFPFFTSQRLSRNRYGDNHCFDLIASSLQVLTNVL